MTIQGAAAEIVRELAPFCQRIEVAGSIRRGKPDPHDIEILAVPDLATVTVQVNMFETHEVQENRLDEELKVWRTLGKIGDRLDKNGRPAYGERFKRLWYLADREWYALDLFSVLPPMAQWGVLFAIRTGPAEFSHLLVTSRVYGGAMLPGYRVAGGALWRLEEMIPTPEEGKFFAALGLPTWPPAERSADCLRAWLSERR